MIVFLSWLYTLGPQMGAFLFVFKINMLFSAGAWAWVTLLLIANSPDSP